MNSLAPQPAPDRKPALPPPLPKTALGCKHCKCEHCKKSEADTGKPKETE